MKRRELIVGLGFALLFTGLRLTSMPADATSLENAEAAYADGACLAAVGQYSNSVTVLQKVIADFSDQKRVCANAKLEIGRAYLALGQIEKAETEFNGLVEGYTDFRRQSAEAMIELGKILEGKREFTQALAFYPTIATKYPDLTPQCAEAKLRIAACHAALGDSDQELTDLSSLLQAYSTDQERCA